MTELSRDAKIRHAWAQTIHKFQVSECLEKKKGRCGCMRKEHREYPLHLCVIANKRGHSRTIPHSIHLINDPV